MSKHNTTKEAVVSFAFDQAAPFMALKCPDVSLSEMPLTPS
jgi:hypothetical protein